MKHFKSLSAATAASVLALSMVATPVFATENTYQTNVDITENSSIEEGVDKVALPDRVVFKYKTLFGDEMVKDFLNKETSSQEDMEKIISAVKDQINPGTNKPKQEDDTQVPTEELDNYELDAFPMTDQLTVTIKNSPKKDADGNNIDNSYETKVSIDINNAATNKITQPGIYFFELKENGHYYLDPTQEGNADEITVTDASTGPTVDGIKEDNNQKVLVAVVVSYNENGEFEVGQVVWYEKNTSDETIVLNKVTDTIHNEWWDKNGESQKSNWSYFEAKYDTYPLTITKNVTGTMGDRTQPFDIKYSITSNNAYAKKLPLKYSDGASGVTEIGDQKGTSPEAIPSAGDTTAKQPYYATLKHGQSVVIHGLSEKDVAKVWENFGTDTNKDGYTVTYSKKADGDSNGTSITEKANVGNATVNAEDALSKKYTVTVNNEKNSGPITGIVHNYGPFALMAAIGAGLIGFFFRRRREE